MDEAPLSVFVDANIIRSKCLIDWVTLCAIQELPLYHVRWSEDVLAEAQYSWRRRYPGLHERAIGIQLDRFRRFHAAGRVIGYDPQDYPRPASDEHDWHVLAAAAHAQVDILLTNDANAFTSEYVQGRFEVQKADEFLLMVLDHRPDIVAAVFEFQNDFYRSTEGRPPEYLLGRLEKAGAARFSREIRLALPQLFRQ
jgi:predicted nucleic acid-binding protein